METALLEAFPAGLQDLPGVEVQIADVLVVVISMASDVSKVGEGRLLTPQPGGSCNAGAE